MKALVTGCTKRSSATASTLPTIQAPIANANRRMRRRASERFAGGDLRANKKAAPSNNIGAEVRAGVVKA